MSNVSSPLAASTMIAASVEAASEAAERAADAAEATATPRKGGRIEFPISAEYLDRDVWSKWAGVRECVQNAKDAATAGAEMTVEHFPRSNRLVITSKGLTMDVRALVYGHSTKRGDDRMIGRHGDGLISALVALTREGCDVRIETGDEAWVPSFEASPKFAGERVLVIRTRKIARRDHVSIEINNVSATEWSEFRKRFFFLLTEAERGETVETSGGDMLLSPALKGRVFVKGIYVQTSENLSAGYNIADLSLDRDRRVISGWDLSWHTSQIIQRASGKNADAAAGLYQNLKKESAADGSAGIEYARGEAVVSDVAARFEAEFGVGTVPVANETEATRIRSLGAMASVVPDGLRKVLQKKTGSFYENVARLTDAGTVSLDPSTLTDAERSVLAYAEETIHNALGEEYVFGVVEFTDGRLGCTDISTGEMRLARKALVSRSRALGTAIHEVAHKRTCDADGSLRHVASIEAIWEMVHALITRGA